LLASQTRHGACATANALQISNYRLPTNGRRSGTTFDQLHSAVSYLGLLLFGRPADRAIWLRLTVCYVAQSITAVQCSPQHHR